MVRQDLEGLVELARKRGARGCELLVEDWKEISMEASQGKVMRRAERADDTLRVSVWLDGGRFGGASGGPEGADALLDVALERASAAEERPWAGPVDRLRPVVGGLGILDRRFATLTDEDREELLIDAERSARAEDRRITTSGFRYLERHTTRRFVNSRGVALEESATRYEATGSAHLEELVVHETVASRTFASVASYPFGTSLGRRAAALVEGTETLDGEVLAMLPPRVVAALFAALGEGFVPDRMEGRVPFFLAPRDGQPVVDTRLHLLDDGNVPGGLRTLSFDDRGVVPIPLTLLREGVPAGCFRDPEGARALDAVPTGHMVGDRLRSTNLLLRGGTRSMNASFTDHGGASLLVDAIDPAHVDLATGVFETTLDGVVMASNRPVGSVRRRRARIDLPRMLGKLRELCSDTDRVGHVDAPALFVEGVTLL